MAKKYPFFLLLTLGEGANTLDSSINSDACSEAPKARDVIARANDPGMIRALTGSAESATVDAPRRQYFEKGAFGDQRISRFQRSIKRQSPHPARWAGLLHFAPSALRTTTCQSHDLMSQVC